MHTLTWPSDCVTYAQLRSQEVTYLKDHRYIQAASHWSYKRVPKGVFPPIQEGHLHGVTNVLMLPKVYSTNPCRHPNIWCNSPFNTILGVAEEVVVDAEDAAAEATHPVQSNCNLLNDFQINVSLHSPWI